MKGPTLDKNFEDVACCKPLYDDLLDGVCEFDLMFKCFYWSVNSRTETYQQAFGFCPYCGERLPNLLSCEGGYHDTLAAAVGKDYCDITEDEIPEEFKSDEWWKKRGL